MYPSAAVASPFTEYAEIYDLLYQDKNYAAEADFVSSLLARFLADQTLSRIKIIDLACGTGRHVFELAQRGYDMSGSDVSVSMIEGARQQASRRGLEIPFYVESLLTCDRIGKRFDAALVMFASLGYVTAGSDFVASLNNVKTLLRPGGLFIFDVWNGLAVVRDYSPLRIKRANAGSRRVLRVSSTTIDEVHQVATVKFEFLVASDQGELKEFSEVHAVRFFFPRELADILEACGFDLVLRCPFMDASKDVSRSDWNMTFVARRPVGVI
jgi:SAM-dependent methyltransferase